jgi:hypothetical protein
VQVSPLAHTQLAATLQVLLGFNVRLYVLDSPANSNWYYRSTGTAYQTSLRWRFTPEVSTAYQTKRVLVLPEIALRTRLLPRALCRARHWGKNPERAVRTCNQGSARSAAKYDLAFRRPGRLPHISILVPLSYTGFMQVKMGWLPPPLWLVPGSSSSPYWLGRWEE